MGLLDRFRGDGALSGRWDGSVTYCSDPALVPFEGHYADEGAGPVPDRPVRWVNVKRTLVDDESGVARVVEIDGWWEHAKR